MERETNETQTVYLNFKNKRTKIHKKFWNESKEDMGKNIVSYNKDENIKISHILA